MKIKLRHLWSTLGLTAVFFTVQSAYQVFEAEKSMGEVLPWIFLHSVVFACLVYCFSMVCDRINDGSIVLRGTGECSPVITAAETKSAENKAEKPGTKPAGKKAEESGKKSAGKKAEEAGAERAEKQTGLHTKIFRALYKNRGVIQVFLILCLVWGVYYHMCYPGNLMWDTGQSILYHLGIDTHNVNNSYFQNIVFGNAYLFGAAQGDPKIGIAVFCSLQFLTYLVVLSYLIDRIGKSSVLMRNLVLVWYLLVPAFPIYAMTMGKDSNFAIVVLLYTGLTFEMVKDPDEFFAGRVRPVLLGATVVFIGLFRNYAHVIPTAAIFCVSFFVFKNKKSRILAISITAVTCFMVYIFPALTNAPKSEIRETLSVPIQQTGFYANNYRDEVTPEEYQKINAIVPFEALEDYDPSISDPIKSQFKADPTGEELRGYFEAWASQFSKHPDAYFQAFYLKSSAYYIPDADKRDVRPHIFSGFILNKGDKPRLGLEENVSEYVDLVQSIDDNAMDIPFFSLFSKIGIYTWLLLICIVRIIQMRKLSLFVCIAPAIMIIVGCLFSPVNGYYRYAYSMILSIPVIFANTILVKKG